MTEILKRKPTAEQATEEKIINTFHELCAGDMSNNRAIETLIKRFGEKVVVQLMPKLMGQKEN